MENILIFISLYYTCVVSCSGSTLASTRMSTCSFPLQRDVGQNQKNKKTGR